MTELAIVIPCRNLGRTLPAAVESARLQTRAPSEIVVVDDGSDDLFTRQTLLSLERDGCRVVRTESCGVAAARNLGIRLTRAPYIIVLDADDMLDARYVEVTAGVLDRHPDVSFVGTAVRGFGDSEWVWTPPPCDLENALARGGPPQSSIFRRHVWDAIGGYDESLPLYADLDFWLRTLERGFQGRIVGEPLLLYRVRMESVHHAAVASGGHADGMRAIYTKHRQLIERLGPPLIVAKHRFIEQQREYAATLRERSTTLTREIETLDAEIAALRSSLGAASLDWGELRRTSPVSDLWGTDRGKPLDRYYIERFLDSHRLDIRGRVLEVKDDGYARRFGGGDVARCDVLDVAPSNRRATLTADLAQADGIPSGAFDCFILTQTLHLIADTRTALAHSARLLKPGGVLLCTVPAVSRISYEDGGRDRDFWRFTEASLRLLFSEAFGVDRFEIEGFGNVLACSAFLYGLAPDELTPAELEAADPWFPLLFGVRAVKS